MKRLLIFLIIGLLVAIVGVVIGISSHQVTYQTVNKEIVAHFLADDGASSSHTGYLQLEKDPNLYIINENDFSPTVASSIFGDGDTISFIYRSVDTNNIDVKAQNTSTHLQGKAYIIEQLSIFDSTGNAKVYSTSEYSQNRQGFYQSNWLLGGPLLAFGLILTALGVILHLVSRRNKLQAGMNGAAPIAMEMPLGPPIDAYQMQAGQNNAPTVEMGMLPISQGNLYQQPYDNSTPYPAFQQQADQFTSPVQFQPSSAQPNPSQAATPYSQPLQYPQQSGAQYPPYPQQPSAQHPQQSGAQYPPQSGAEYPQQSGAEHPQQNGLYEPTQRGNQ